MAESRTRFPMFPALVRYSLAVLLFIAIAMVASRTVRIETDFAAFLPPSTTAEERLLIAQLRDGLVSRLMLIALEGADEKTLARTSRGLAVRLGRTAEFEYAANGSLNQFIAQGEILMKHRYALSPEVRAERFALPALRAALEEQQAQIVSPFGAMSRTILARDPTGELLAILKRLDSGASPMLRQGVWFSADGKRAFLIAQTRAAGFDSERQDLAMTAVRQALAAENAAVKLTLTGPGVFAAESRRLIRSDAEKLGMLSTLVILAILIFVYRSVLPVALVIVPVAFGLLVGVVMVNAWFGSVHAITLGFAATLIGEAVDYPSYLLLNTAPGEAARTAARRIGRTLALAVLTTVVSALALTLSSFQGLAQLGVLTMVGVLVAGICTHFLIPWLLGDHPLVFRRLHMPAANVLARMPWLRPFAAMLVIGGGVWLAATHPAWWESDLASISPVPPEMRARDATLRKEMGAPEVSIFVASRGASEADALATAEQLVPTLQIWKEQGLIKSFDSPAIYLPAPATQTKRLAALPDREALETSLRAALRGLAFRADAFAPFVDEVAVAKQSANTPPVTVTTYAGTPLGAKLGALVLQLEGQWLVLTPLAGLSNPDVVAKQLTDLPGAGSRLVDLKKVSTHMVDGFRREASVQALWGAGLIVILLIAGLASFRRAWRVALPAAAALILTVTLLVVAGTRLSVFHLVALLLVLGIGLNYALFFERVPPDADERARTRLALAVCSISTIVTFGFLSLSATPVLHAIGSTVAMGAALALLMSALWARPTSRLSGQPNPSDKAHDSHQVMPF